MTKKKILITSVDLGGWHKAVKNSLVESLKNDDTLEVMEYHSQQQIYEQIYRFIVQFPKLYKKIHDNSAKHVSYAQYLIQWLEYLPLQKLIKKNHPDVIICTHAFHVFAFDALRKFHGYTYKIVNVVCDYGDQRFYVDGIEGFDWCLVRDELTRKCISHYVPRDRILLFGTLVHPVFHQISQASTDQVEKVFAEWFKSIFPWTQSVQRFSKILIIGGSGWTRKSLSLILLLAKQKKYHIFVSCGKDTDLLKELKNIEHIFPFGFVDQETLAYIEWAMDMIVLSSLAPATMLEVCTLGKFPLLVHRYIEGQEQEHIRLLDVWKIGIYEKNDKKMLELIYHYISKPQEAKKMIHNGMQLVKKNQELALQNPEVIHYILNH